MSNEFYLKRHNSTLNILFNGLSNIFGKGNFDDFSFKEKEDKYFVFSIAGERLIIKASFWNNNTKFTTHINDIDPNNYPNRKLGVIEQFDFVSDDGKEFKFTNIPYNPNYDYIDLDHFIQLYLNNIMGYLCALDKSSFKLHLLYKYTHIE